MKMEKMRKLSYRLGDLKYVEVFNDWRKCKGIKAKKTETNMGLAERDYSVECKETHNLLVIEGFWIWWCETHNQPSSWCERAKLNIKIKELEDKIMNAQVELEK